MKLLTTSNKYLLPGKAKHESGKPAIHIKPNDTDTKAKMGAVLQASHTQKSG